MRKPVNPSRVQTFGRQNARKRPARRSAAAALAAAFMISTASPVWAQISAPTPPGQMVTSYLTLAAERAGIIGAVKDNVAEKRSLEQQYTTVDAADAKYKHEIATASAFCQGKFTAEEVARRRKICEAKQRELDIAFAANKAQRDQFDKRDRSRKAAALRLKASYDAVVQRAKAVEEAMAQQAVLKPLIEMCHAQSDLTVRAQCVADHWAAAAPKPRFPEPPVPLVNAKPQDPDRTKVVADWAILELAASVYGIKTMPGQSPFAGNHDWKMLEIADARALPEKRAALKAMGFNAYSYVNEQGKMIVVAVQGSRVPDLDAASTPATRADVIQDWWVNDMKKALITGDTPPQFEAARQYVEAIKQAYGDKYTIVCSGHSLGGGACAYAAGMEGVRAVVINPISSSASTRPENAPLIDNYVVEGELASEASGFAGRAVIGHQYRINNYREPGGVVKTVENTFSDHGVDTAMDDLARQVGLSRIK